MPTYEMRHLNRSHDSNNDASAKLGEEVKQEIFRLLTDKGTGTAFRGPDGRLITTYRNIATCTELFAEQDGKKYRVGKNLIIDDVNDLAVMEFVDQPPPSNRTLTVSQQRSIEPAANLNAVGFGGRNNFRFEQSNVQVSREIQQRHFENDARTGFRLVSNDNEAADATSFLQRPLLKLTNDVSTLQGGPIISQHGEVVGVNVVGNGKHGGAIPANKLADLLALELSQSAFTITSGYETGISTYIRVWQQWPGRQAARHIPPVIGIAMATFSKNPGFVMPGAILLLSQLSSDLDGRKSSIGNLERNHFGIAAAADVSSLIGLALGCIKSKWRPLGLTMAAGGLAVRAATELMPYRYTIQKTQRKDGDNRRPFDPTPQLFYQPIK